jgi:hypothetical protein
MVKLIWVDDLLAFKIIRVYTTQYLCVCVNAYKEQLDMNVGDIVFIRDTIKVRSYKRLGPIKAFNEPNKVIVGIMADIGIGSKSVMTQRHEQSLTEEGISEEEIEIENDGSLYGGKKHKKTKRRRSKSKRRTKRYN